MFKILEKQKQILVTTQEAKEMYPKCNFLLLDTVDKNSVVSGTIYAISEEPETLKDLSNLEDELQTQGHKVFIGGDYYPSCIFDYMQIIGEK